MNESIKTIQTYIETPEGSAWFMGAVGKAIQSIDLEKSQRDYEAKRGYTMADFDKERGKWQQNDQRLQDEAAIKIRVSRSLITKVMEYQQTHKGEKDAKYRPYLTDDEQPRLDFYLEPYMNGGYPGDRKWISIFHDDYEKILTGKITRIHDKSVKPYYFDVVLMD